MPNVTPAVAAKTGPTPVPSSLLAMPSMGMWPVRYEQAPPTVRDAYLFAVDHRAELRYIPCFCGCYRFGHKSNRDCYVKAFNADGTLTFTSHAAT